MMGNDTDYYKEINLFMRIFCASAEARYRIPDFYDINAHVHDVYAPGHKVYGWANMGELISDEGIMFVARNKRNGRYLYPVFKPAMAMDMLKHWEQPMPLKWSVYADDYKKTQKSSKVHPVNQEMRNLLVYARCFISLQHRMMVPLPYAFEETYEQINRFPEESIDAAAVVLINREIQYSLALEGTFNNCKHLQEYIAYLRNRYTLLEFVNGDFPLLRRMLAKEAPGKKCFF